MLPCFAEAPESFLELDNMASRFLVPMKRSGTANPLFFVPSAGTTILSLAGLARAFEGSHPFHAFEFSELPVGWENPVTIEQISTLCTQEIRAIQKEGPYFVGGHCWGGVVAFDIATRLEAAGESVAAITLLESVPPQRDRDGDLASPEVAKAISNMFQQVQNRLADMSAALASRFGPVTWELIKLAQHYKVTGPVRAPIFLIRTKTYPPSVFAGWPLLTNGDFEECIMPENTFSLLDATNVMTVGAVLGDALANVMLKNSTNLVAR